MIAGIDISINGTGCSFEDESFHFHTGLKKLPKKIDSIYISGYTVKEFNKDGNAERYFQNAQNILSICLDKKVHLVGIENYAYGYGGQNPGRVFDIAEFTGMIKCLLIQNNIQIKTFTPSEIKKFATKKGNASKVLMCEQYFNDNKNSPLIDFINEFKLNKYESPINDLVDSWYIMNLTKQFYHLELK